MNSNELKRTFEALVFSSGDPLPADRACEILECDKKQLDQAAKEIQQQLKDRDSALELIRINDCWQLTTKQQYAVYIRKMLEIQRNTPLSQAAFEVLAVVAYNQPVTKSFVEQVRGVDCSGVMSSLIEKDLIEERGRLELPGRPLIYGTTDRFLRCFSLESLSDLPPLPEADKEKAQNSDDGKQTSAVAEPNELQSTEHA